VNLNEALHLVETKFLKNNLPDITVGDTLKMRVKVIEAEKVRIHPFEGVVIRKRGRGLNATFTVRKISFGEGVERTFPLHSPMIESIEIVSRGKNKRARLYYLRRRTGKSARLEAVAPAS